MAQKPYIGMNYKCCKLYQRIYINKEKTAFVGLCPKCGAKAEVKIDPKGESTKFFEAK